MRSTVSRSIIAYKDTNNSGKGTGKTVPKRKNPERELLLPLQQTETGRRKEIAQPGNNLQKPRQAPGFQPEFSFVLPGSAQEKPQIAEVLAVGPGTQDDPMELKVGDKVIFSPYGGTEIKYGGEEVVVMNHRDILAVVE